MEKKDEEVRQEMLYKNDLCQHLYQAYHLSMELLRENVP